MLSVSTWLYLQFPFKKYNHFKTWKMHKKEIASTMFLAIENETQINNSL